MGKRLAWAGLLIVLSVSLAGCVGSEKVADYSSSSPDTIPESAVKELASNPNELPEIVSFVEEKTEGQVKKRGFTVNRFIRRATRGTGRHSR